MSTYKKSGVDIKLSDKFTEFLEKKSKAIGGFAGLLPIGETGDKYSMVASTDGVGTKLKLAFYLDRHDTIGIDLVAMCVNDLLCCGARPMMAKSIWLSASRRTISSRLCTASVSSMPGWRARN